MLGSDGRLYDEDFDFDGDGKLNAYEYSVMDDVVFGDHDEVDDDSEEEDDLEFDLAIALIAGCGRACELAEGEYINNNEKVCEIKKAILRELDKSDISYIVNGNQDFCIDNTINVCFEGVSSEALMLSSKMYCGVSNGSACTSKSYSPSYVLAAMGIPEEQIECSIRISWGANTDIAEAVSGVKVLFSTASQFGR